VTHRPQIAQLASDFTRLSKAFSALRQIEPLLPGGVEASAIPILFKLSNGPLRVGQLAHLLHSDISTVSRQTSSLVARGLVAKTRDSDDGRVQQLALTDQGVELAGALREQRCHLLDLLLAEWPDDELDSAAQAVHRLADAIESMLRDPQRRQVLEDGIAGLASDR